MPTFNIEVYLKAKRSLVDRALKGYFRSCQRYPETLYHAMRYGVFPGGKRLRPILTWACGELFGGQRSHLLPFACALELVHAYSLIHDDLPALDNDDFRRGKLATHKVFGEGIALLAGDALLTEAFYLLAHPRLARLLETETVRELIHEMAYAAGAPGMVGGQVVDLEAEGQKLDLSMIENIHLRKTGALILVASRGGARIAGAGANDLRKITRYAKCLGLAFQIVDDILDSQISAQTGRGGSREKQNKKTSYLSVAGLTGAKNRVEELLRRSLKEIELFGKNADPLRGIAHYVAERAQ